MSQRRGPVWPPPFPFCGQVLSTIWWAALNLQVNQSSDWICGHVISECYCHGNRWVQRHLAIISTLFQYFFRNEIFCDPWKVFFFNSGPLCAWRHFWNDFGWENWIFQRKFLGRFITEMKTRKITAIVSANFHSGSIVVFTGTTPFMKIVKWNKLAFLFYCGRHLALNCNFPSRFRRRFSSSD